MLDIIMIFLIFGLAMVFIVGFSKLEIRIYELEQRRNRK